MNNGNPLWKTARLLFWAICAIGEIHILSGVQPMWMKAVALLAILVAAARIWILIDE